MAIDMDFLTESTL